MSTANDVMTQSLATCSPDDTVARAASIMRDRDVGNVLVMESGKLCGIVTDRDLAVHALTDQSDPLHTPVRDYMNPQVVTGKPGWNLNKVARTMAKHQVRRLPILQDDQLVGIISLGDLAQHVNRNRMVSSSLKAISSPHNGNGVNGSSRTAAVIGLSMLALGSTAVALLTWNHGSKDLRKKVADSKAYQSAQQAVSFARDKMDEAASSKQMRHLRQRVGSNLKDLSYQLPSLQYKPARKKFTWFR